MERINENMNILEILDLSPELENVFLRYGLPCAGCPGGLAESLKEAAESHGVDCSTLLCDLQKQLAAEK